MVLEKNKKHLNLTYQDFKNIILVHGCRDKNTYVKSTAVLKNDLLRTYMFLFSTTTVIPIQSESLFFYGLLRMAIIGIIAIT